MADREVQYKLKRIVGRLRGRAVDPLAFCLAAAGVEPILPLPESEYVRALLAGMAWDERCYWSGALYSLLLDKAQRKQQAAYFTPPALARQLIALAERYGSDLTTAQVLDPAAGGAAFLATVAARMLELGRPPEAIAGALTGLEIDPRLVTLSRRLVEARLERPLAPNRIRQADATRAKLRDRVDLVLANPPFGRRLGDGLEGVAWREVAAAGHVNIYAIFVRLALRWAKPGGLVGLIIPSSFMGGPFYERLRRHIRQQAQVLAVGVADQRDDLFMDVTQDICLLMLRRSDAGHPAGSEVEFATVNAAGTWTNTARLTLPKAAEDAWVLPPQAGDRGLGGATLTDYGVAPSVGYFVWNRQRQLLRGEAEPGAVPLVWACNVRPGEPCKPKARKGDGVDYVHMGAANPTVVRGPAVVMQRTTNSKQQRRLVAAVLDASVSAFVAENHTILLRPTRPDVDLSLVAQLLNTEAADARYRRLSGTASISATLLKRLDLPSPVAFRGALARQPDPELAAKAAYGNAADEEVA